MAFTKSVVIACLVIIVSACGTSKVSRIPSVAQLTHPIKAIAMAPEGGMLAEAVGIELSNMGYRIIDPSSTSKLMIRLNLDEIEVSTPQGLEKLRDYGIDAFLTVKSAGAYDGQVQSASARATSTHNGRIVAGVSWQNGWGGMAGSMADRTMRKGFAEAAQEIASALAGTLPLN